MEFLIILLLILFAIGFSQWVSRVNRPNIELHDLAKNLIRERLLHDNAIANSDVSDACDTCQKYRGKATRVLIALAAAVGLPHWRPPTDIPLGELFRINRSVLARGKAHIASSDVIEPFAYDIVESLLPITDQKAWRSRWRLDHSLPKDEEALIDFLMQMDICQLLDFFVPLMRDELDDSSTV